MDPVLKPDFYILLLIFQHKWMFLSTMQTLPNQIPLGPAEMISLLSFLVEWGFLFVLNMYISGPLLRISICWVFGLHYINLLVGLWRKKWTLRQTTPPTWVSPIYKPIFSPKKSGKKMKVARILLVLGPFLFNVFHFSLQ